MTPQEIAQSGLLPGTPVVVTRNVRIGFPLIAWGGVTSLSPTRRTTIFMHPVDWYVVFTGRTQWEAVVAVLREDFDTKWERASWREMGADR